MTTSPPAAVAVSQRARDYSSGLIEALADHLRDKDAWLRTAEALRHGAKGRVDFRFLPEAFARFETETLALVKREIGGEGLTGEDAWDELVNVDDRTSPEEYPDMCLITRDELVEFMSRALPTPPVEHPAGEVGRLAQRLKDHAADLRREQWDEDDEAAYRIDEAAVTLLSSLSPPAVAQEVREGIAWLIDPYAAKLFDAQPTEYGSFNDNVWQNGAKGDWQKALAKADAILATLSPDRSPTGVEAAISGLKPKPGHAPGCGVHDDYWCDCVDLPYEPSISLQDTIERVREGMASRFSGAIYDHLRNYASRTAAETPGAEG